MRHPITKVTVKLTSKKTGRSNIQTLEGPTMKRRKAVEFYKKNYPEYHVEVIKVEEVRFD